MVRPKYQMGTHQPPKTERVNICLSGTPLRQLLFLLNFSGADFGSIHHARVHQVVRSQLAAPDDLARKSLNMARSTGEPGHEDHWYNRTLKEGGISLRIETDEEFFCQIGLKPRNQSPPMARCGGPRHDRQPRYCCHLDQEQRLRSNQGGRTSHPALHYRARHG